MRRIAFCAFCAVLTLAACSQAPQDRQVDDSGGSRLERAAIARGIIPDPSDIDPTGLYARGADQVCIAPAAEDFRIGFYSDYGRGQHCSARGIATRNKDALSITIDNRPGCRFVAHLEGDRLQLPAALPAACDAVCTGRSSLSAILATRMSDTVAEASTLRGLHGQLLCAGG